MRRAHISSLSELLGKAKVHRNTLHHYLTGKRAVVAEPLQRLARIVNVDSLSLLTSDNQDQSDEQSLVQILKQQVNKEPSLAFVLLGSRAKGTASRYADWDVGLSLGKGGLSVESYLRIKGEVQEAVEAWPYQVDVVNLDLAPAWFLAGIDYEPHYLAGDRESYHYFLGTLHGYRQSAAVKEGR